MTRKQQRFPSRAQLLRLAEQGDAIPGGGSCRRLLCTGLFLCGLVTASAFAAPRPFAFAESERVPAGDAYTLAAYLQAAPDVARVEFAAAALNELIAVYHEEAERARADRRQGGADGDLSRWIRAVDRMVVDLEQVSESLFADASVLVSAQDANTLYLVVDGQPILVSGPRKSQQSLLQHRILQAYCSRNDCTDLADSESLAAAPAPREPDNPPVWRFGDAAGPVCATGDGLEFQFASMRDLQPKREACNRVVAELQALVRALQQAREHGMRIDWNGMKLRADGAGASHAVVVNASGDAVPVAAPTLAGSPTLFGLVLPWLAAKTEGARYNLVILHAERRLGLQP